jgi:hypothetical protein
MQPAPWQIPVAALETEAVTTGVREIGRQRPKFYKRFQEDKTLDSQVLNGRLHYVARSPSLLRKMNTWPLNG